MLDVLIILLIVSLVVGFYILFGWTIWQMLSFEDDYREGRTNSVYATIIVTLWPLVILAALVVYLLLQLHGAFYHVKSRVVKTKPVLTEEKDNNIKH